MANKTNGNKGDIQILVEPISKACKWIKPDKLKIFIGNVITDANGNKSVGLATPKELGVFLSEKDAEILQLQKELNEEKIKNRKVQKKMVDILKVLIGQMQLNSLEINELLDMEEEE